MPACRSVLAVLAGLLVACAPEPEAPPAPLPVPAPATATWAGSGDDRHFYPVFQRYRVATVEVLPDAEAAPQTVENLRLALQSRDVYLGPGYVSAPALDGTGEEVTPACFTTQERHLRVLPVTATAGETSATAGKLFPSGDPRVLTRRTRDERVDLRIDETFLVILEGRPVADDNGFQLRRLNTAFNSRLAALVAQGTTPTCDLRPLAEANRPARDLVLKDTDSRRQVTLTAADLDPETDLNAVGASAPRRRELPMGDPDAIVSGCAGVVRLMRTVLQPSADTPGQEDFFLVSGVAGKTAEGEVCDRVQLIRRIDAGGLRELFRLPAPAQIADSRLHLLGWVNDSTLTVRLGAAEFELAAIDKPQVQVTLLKAPAGMASADVELEPEAEGPSPPATPSKPARTSKSPAKQASTRPIVRWVDEQGVVHYSNDGSERRRR